MSIDSVPTIYNISQHLQLTANTEIVGKSDCNFKSAALII